MSADCVQQPSQPQLPRTGLDILRLSLQVHTLPFPRPYWLKPLALWLSGFWLGQPVGRSSWEGERRERLGVCYLVPLLCGQVASLQVALPQDLCPWGALARAALPFRCHCSHCC